jgi:hypothetical protein
MFAARFKEIAVALPMPELAPCTVKWKYADSSRHIDTKSVVTGH